MIIMIPMTNYHYDDPNYDYDDTNYGDTDDDGVGHLLRGEKGLDSNLLSSPACQPNFPISERIIMNTMNTMNMMNMMNRINRMNTMNTMIRMSMINTLITNKNNDDDQLVR